MVIKSIQDILPLVEQPSRYLGSEVNRIKKNHNKVKLSFLLAFPDLYEIGMSNFGIQILYSILNSCTEIAAERIFAPGIDMEAYLRKYDIPLVSLESQKPINEFNIIGFSLLYELNFTNVLTILELAKIPFFASQRDTSHPLIIGGGTCTCNPEPFADFFDAIVVGDGERVAMEMSLSWIKWNDSSHRDKDELLKMWSKIEGVYIPTFFETEYDKSGFQSLRPKLSNYSKVKRAIIEDLDHTPFPDAPIIPYGKTIHDRLRLEVARGCSRGCRFCQAGMIYRPIRERSMDNLITLFNDSIHSTGYEDISLLSLSTGDYSCITPLLQRLMLQCETEHISVSLPSLRAGTLTPELMHLIKKVRKTGFTIAPEAGSQRLRNVINKNITEKEIIDTVSATFIMGWQVIKLYFMIGLPTETDEDLQSLIDLVKKLRKLKGEKGQKCRLNVSVATFIPKAHTPFQWASQMVLRESKEKIKWLQNALRLPGIQFKWQNPEVSILEGLFARGDRRLSHLLVSAYKKGCKFDGWSDKFHYNLWECALQSEGIDLNFYTTRQRNLAEALPWDHVDSKVTKNFLKTEWIKAIQEQPTLDCRNGECKKCGVCDFQVLQPKISAPCVMENDDALKPKTIPNPSYKTFKVSYSKQNIAKHLGHLELVNVITRALKRAEIPVKFSEGFHPLPKISFDDPLPIGIESVEEFFYLTVPEAIKPRDVTEGLNKHLPTGLFVNECLLASHKALFNKPTSNNYIVTLKDAVFDKGELAYYKSRPELIYSRTNRKGKTSTIDLKKFILKIDLLAPSKLEITIQSQAEKTVRPIEAISKIFSLSEKNIKIAAIVKNNKREHEMKHNAENGLFYDAVKI
ncbi:MAG: TIGR03960 family B12-binding radical SAM protein [Desulfobacterales bacterium]|nr:TIGR03960 family B12-binding radical SAM protein [Desulfobacterales bacterium]